MYMSQDAFQTECDRLSQTVDAVQFERLRWARTEAPMLAHLIAMAQGAVEPREDFELTEEGSTTECKRFVLKVHGTRVIAVAMGLEHAGAARVWAEPIERSRFKLAPGEALTAPFDAVDQAWMAAAFQDLFGRVTAT